MVDFIDAKYHLAVAERMMLGYEGYPEKRFLVGIINEAAKAASRLIRAFLIYEKTKGDINTFSKRIAPRYLDKLTHENLMKILEIERAQKISRIEYAKDDKIILLIFGKYRILTASRLQEFISSLKNAVSNFPTDIKR